MVTLLPNVFITLVAFSAKYHAGGRVTVGRLAFIVALGTLATSFYRILHPKTGVWCGFCGGTSHRVLARLYPVFFLLVMLLPFLFIGFILAGFVIKEFISGRLLNWSLSDPVTRILLPVGVAYGSDVQKAIDLKFREGGLSIAFPQRDIHLDTSRPLDIRILREKAMDLEHSPPETESGRELTNSVARSGSRGRRFSR
jgi:hypothetical protein